MVHHFVLYLAVFQACLAPRFLVALAQKSNPKETNSASVPTEMNPYSVEFPNRSPALLTWPSLDVPDPTPVTTILTGTNSVEPTHYRNGTSTTAYATSGVAPPLPSNTQPCNQHIELCDRSYGKITYVGAHNSAFVRPNNAATNQRLDVAAQLNDGIRMLQGQVHKVNHTLYYCHESCALLNAGKLEDYLRKVVDWLGANPFEIVSILIGNGDFAPIQDFVAPFGGSGIVEYAYVPDNRTLSFDQWPTLSELILKGKRAIIFVDYGADERKVPWLLDQFTYMWETPFSQTDPDFPCHIHRPSKGKRNHDKLYMANHNLDLEFNVGVQSGILVPNLVAINQTNGASGFGSLGLHAETCKGKLSTGRYRIYKTTLTQVKAMWKRYPNFLLVDFYESGNGSVFEVAAKANNVTYNWDCCGKEASSSDCRPELNPVLVYFQVLMFVGLFTY